ncbi:MAG: hypothetical protein ABJN69_06175 [Hellea sp.]
MTELSRRKTILTSFALLWPGLFSRAQASEKVKKVRVIVALADNKYQGIVPISENLGNGQSARTNLYWGALYGVKTYFSRHKDWTKIQSSAPEGFAHILDHASFKRAATANSGEVLLSAEAWNGAYIGQALSRFYALLSDSSEEELVVFVGHNTLMDKFVPKPIATTRLKNANLSRKRKAIILACGSSAYFDDTVKDIGVTPLLTTKGLMAPEAYSLEAALSAWAKGASDAEIRLAAAKSYAKFQKIPERNARWLFSAKR